MAKAIKTISLVGSNLHLVGGGRDKNGNSLVKVKFPNGRAFSIQTNQQGLFGTKNALAGKKLDELTKTEIKTISSNVRNYVKNYGSDSQKKKLRIYK